MKYAPLFFLSLLLPNALKTQCVTTLSSGTQSDLYNVAFWNATTGVAVGDSGIVVRTTDGGNSWTRPTTRTQQNLRGVFALNSGGLKAWAVGADGTIRYTADGGQTWVQQPAPVRTDLHAVAFSSANNGLAVGDCGVVLRTTNGGATWTRVDAKTTETLYTITFQANTAIAAGDNGTVCRSTDGGATWTATTLGSQPWRNLAGNFWLAGADLRRTVNGGGSWTSIPTGGANWYGIDVSSSGQQILLAGAGGKIFLSGNGGVSWENRSSAGITTLLRDVAFVPADSSTAYVCGSGGRLARVRLPLALASAPQDTLCPGTTIQLSGNGGAPYSWSGPGGYTATVQNPTRPNATPAMSGAYTLTATAAPGCTDTAVVNVTVRNPPTAGASAVKPSLCAGETLQLNASGGSTYSWNGPGGYTASGPNPTRPNATTTMSGPYTVTATDANGCTDTAVVNVTVLNPPTAAASAVKPSLCAGETLQLNASGGGTYTWSGPGGYTASGPNPARLNATTDMSGPYTVTAIDANGCTDTAVVSIAVNALPTAVATGGALGCLNPVLTLQGQSDTPGASYAWSGPGGFTSGEQNPQVNVPGDYTLTVTANGCTQTATATVTGASPVGVSIATPGGVQLTCNQPTLTLIAQPTPAGAAYAFAWSGGLGAGQQTTASGPGVYAVTVTDTGSGCSNVATVTLNGSPSPPVATAVGGLLGCGGGSVQLQGGSTISGALFSWSGPGGFVSNAQNPSVSLVGAYTLTVTAPGNCTGTATAIVAPTGSVPQPVITGSATFCGDTVTLGVAPPLYTRYAWSTGDTTQTIAATAPGTYSVTVTDPSGCTGTDAYALAPGASLTPAISGPNSTCGGTVTLDAGPGYKTYLWSTGAKTRTIPVGAMGTYRVTVTNGPACTGSDAHVVDATAPATASITGPAQVCGGGTATLSATPGFSAYLWSNGQSSSTITVGAGTYSVTVTSDKGCTATAVQTVTSGTAIFTNLDTTICRGESVLFGGQQRTETAVYTATFPGSGGCDSIVQLTLVVLSPGISVVSPQDLCEGNTIVLQASGCPGCDFAWSDNLGFDASVTASPTQTATYTVTATDAQGCSQVETITVRVRPAQRILVQESICSGQTFTYNNKTYNKTGQYTDFVLSPEGCTDTVTIELYVVVVEPFFTRPDLMILAPGEEEDMLNVAANDSVPPGLEYTVSFFGAPPVAGSLSASADGSVTYRLIDDDFRGAEKLPYRICDAECGLGCDTGMLEVRILQFSTAFSPNGDGVNDVWDPLEIYRQMGVDFDESATALHILNRWGERLYSAEPYMPWDGKVNGREAPADTYYYILFVGNGQVDKRAVTVMR